MSVDDVNAAIFLLGLLSVYIVYDVIMIGFKYKWSDYRCLFRVIFFIVYPFSGLVHLLDVSASYRGFFDSYLSFKWDGKSVNVFSVALISGFYFLFGLFSRSVGVSRAWMLREFDKSLFMYFGFAFLFVGLLGFYKISGVIDLTVIERQRDFPPGMAKYVFMSQWLVWGVAFLMCYVVLNEGYSDNLVFYIVLLSLSLVFVSLMWTGGRSVLVLFSLPLVLFYRFYRPRLSTRVILLGVVVFVLYVVVVTMIRREGNAFSGGVFQVFDWEYGRYSMVAYAIDYVGREGFLLGESILDGFLKVFLSPFYMLGFGFDFVGGSEGSIVHYIGYDITGVYGATFIVPGIITEFYINFGVFGVVLAAFLVGRLVAWISNALSADLGALQRLFFLYVGSVVCFNFLNSTFFAFLNYVFYMGFPLLLLLFFNGMNFRTRTKIG